jgi:choloylglycine hydrolase
MKRHFLVTVALFVASVFASTQFALACTGLCVKPKDGSAICARTLEFAVDFHANILVIPRNYDFVGTASGGQQGLRWRSKYGMTGANGFNLTMIADGLNEKGLDVGIFYLPGYTKYQAVPPGQASRSMASWELPVYLLGTCATVPEAVAATRKVLVSDATLPEIHFTPSFHFAVHDAAGRCAVIEYVDGELKIHDNPLGVVTNAPTFDWHLTNLSNYVNLSATNVPPIDLSGVTISGVGQGSGMLGLPGDFTPPSRFIRAVAFSQTALPVATVQEGILQAFHLLNQFDIPKGAARQVDHGQVHCDFTMWTSASDLTNHRYYFHTYQNRRIRMIDLNKVNLDAKQPTTISMDQPEEIEDLSAAAK